MRKLLISISIIASFFLGACSQDPIVNKLPWVYRIELQQGNVITQESVNQIREGMNKRQVQFVLGAPMLVDPFHANRWDYFYSYNPGTLGKGESAQRHLSLFFEEDRLTHMGGTMHPELDPDEMPRSRQMTVDVPPQEREDPGVLTRLWRWIGFGEQDEYNVERQPSPPPQQPGTGGLGQ
ncbi:outer membrane protein assembly factor BamE [Thiogranum longum]